MIDKGEPHNQQNPRGGHLRGSPKGVDGMDLSNYSTFVSLPERPMCSIKNKFLGEIYICGFSTSMCPVIFKESSKLCLLWWMCCHLQFCSFFKDDISVLEDESSKLPQQDSDQLCQTVVVSSMLHLPNRTIISIILHFIVSNCSHGSVVTYLKRYLAAVGETQTSMLMCVSYLRVK